MKRYRSHIIYIAVFALTLLMLYLLLVLCAAIPNKAIQANMRKSASYHAQLDNYTFSEDRQFRNVTDNLADRMWLNIGWHMGRGDPFLHALDTEYYDGEKFGSALGLHMSVHVGKSPNADYSRYWHGSAGIIRLGHLFTDIGGIKTLGMLFLVLLIGQTLWLLIRLGHWDLALCTAAALLCVQVQNLRLSAEYLPTFLICFGMCPAFLKLERKGSFYLKVLSVMTGTLTAFFDFLTTETVTILVPLILVVAIRSRQRRLGSPRRVMKLLLECLLCWALAYGGAFLAKWILVSLATGQNHFLSALASAGERVGGFVSTGMAQKRPNPFTAVAANFSVIFQATSRVEYGRVLAGLAICAVLMAALVRMYCMGRKPYPGTFFLLMPGLLVLLRYCVLANHSYLHAFFTYRALVSVILGIACAFALNLRPVPMEEWYE